MIQLNGEYLAGYDNKSLAQLISDLHYDITKIAVECNGSIIPKSLYKTSVLNENDVLEIVTFVGGG
ncbi:MAG: sulfur carrier protein ThiS [Clostridium sp.]|nr:sulfur carrier protein ThiS [Clostridium sp.]